MFSQSGITFENVLCRHAELPLGHATMCYHRCRCYCCCCCSCSCCCCGHKANLKMRPQRMGFIMGLVAVVASRLQVPEAKRGGVCGGGGIRGGSSAAASAEQSRPRALQSSSSATSSCLLKALHLRRTHHTQHTQHTTDDNNDRRQQVNVITEQLPLSAPPSPCAPLNL